VIYDRDGSTVSQTPSERYNWSLIFADAAWLHISGITPAISRVAAESTLAAVTAARSAGATVSCDLNYRKKLWRWDESTEPRDLAERTMRDILPLIDVLIANEEDCGDVLGIRAVDTDVQAGKLAADRYPDVARQIIGQFPNISLIGITLRESISASHNNWGGMLYDPHEDLAHFAPLDDGGTYRPYAIHNIVDRVGAGDAFAAALIFARTTPELTAPHDAVRFAVAASCLAHSVVGDFNFASRDEIESLMRGSASGRVVR
jgi:2-dehydro-3-deoxygluconokinase